MCRSDSREKRARLAGVMVVIDWPWCPATGSRLGAERMNGDVVDSAGFEVDAAVSIRFSSK